MRSKRNSPGAGRRVRIESLGCPRNAVDSEVLAGVLEAAGHRLVGAGEAADIVLINTCGFIEAAVTESVETILKAAEEKRAGRVERIVVAGCLPQRYRADGLPRVLGEVDAWIGPGDLARIDRVVARLGGAGPVFEVGESPEFLYDHDTPRRRLGLPHVAYVKVSEGCRHACTYCLIPSIRGPVRSRRFESIIAEAEGLAADGPVPEMVLVGQDTAAYGIDLYGRNRIAELTQALARSGAARRIRLLYGHPHRFPLDLLDVMASEATVCSYLDLPLQHINDRVLRAMGRETSRRDIEALIDQLRRRVPGIVIRTTLMVGFPGETEAEFGELLDFAAETRFDRLGAFRFSPEAGAPASLLPDPVSEATGWERLDRLMELQADISLELNRALMGREFELLIDGPWGDDPAKLLGRTEGHAPEVDEGVVVPDDGRLSAGEFVRATITGAETYHLIGEPAAR